MQVVDFQKSFLTLRIDTEKKPPQSLSHKPPYSLNNARIQIECRCQVFDAQAGTSETFVLGANCKTEQVGVLRDVWLEPNADFVPIVSPRVFLFLKTYPQVGMDVARYPLGTGRQSDRQYGLVADALDSLRIDVVERPGEPLATSAAIVQAILGNRTLVARTEIASGRYRAVIDYPVRTINGNERDWIYQTDTGPLLLPDFESPPDEVLQRMELAFSAFNGPDWIEMIVRVPTPVVEGVSVYHYTRTARFDARNQLFALD